MKKIQIIVSVVLLIIIIFFSLIYIENNNDEQREKNNIVKSEKQALGDSEPKSDNNTAVKKYKSIIPELKEEITVFEIIKKDSISKPLGKISLSLKKSTENNNNLFFFDIKENKLSSFLLDEKKFHYGLVSNNVYSFYVELKNEFTNIVMADKDGKELKKLLTKSHWKGIIQKIQKISEDKVIFSFLPEQIWGGASSYEVFEKDIKNNEKPEKLFNGSNPLYNSKENKTLFLADAGLFIYDNETKNKKFVVSLRDKKNNPILNEINVRMSLSKNNKFLSWSNFERGEFYIFEILNWDIDNFEYKEKVFYKIDGFWSAFSPDSNYIAIQTAKKIEGGVPIEAKLNIYDIVNHKKVFVKELFGYQQDSMWLTEWIK